MSISLLLEMALSGDPERVAVVSEGTRLTTQELSDLADGGAGVIAGTGAEHVVYVGTGGALLPLLLFSSARAAKAFTPINYRLSAEGIRRSSRGCPSRWWSSTSVTATWSVTPARRSWSPPSS